MQLNIKKTIQSKNKQKTQVIIIIIFLVCFTCSLFFMYLLQTLGLWLL